MQIHIFQGHRPHLADADVNIVIDVIRAFTFAHLAFNRGVQRIILAQSVADAMALRVSRPHLKLAGEVNGLAIPGFDYDNSPFHISDIDMREQMLVQKTTNGVKAALASMGAELVLVTGFTNALSTATYTKKWIQQDPARDWKIQIIASHPTSDEDLACAEYIRGLLDTSQELAAHLVKERIQNAEAAAKFLDPLQPEFAEEDIAFCVKETVPEFAMQVRINESDQPTIERVFLT